ncbi:hypothetical protein DL98DRAFT_590670 [Cadophora sp. DSE1049]|nr:hypothetical protein DL98DRAFT_590670 [Cadophora sp. DSE1049]
MSICLQCLDFEPVRDHKEDIVQDQDYQDLTNYTNYLSRELPGIVRGMLEVELGRNLQQQNNADVQALLLLLLPQALNQSFQGYRLTLRPVSALVTGASPGNSLSQPNEKQHPVPTDFPLGVELSGMQQLRISNGGGQPSESSFDSDYAIYRPSSMIGVVEGITAPRISPTNDEGPDSDANLPIATSEPTPRREYTPTPQAVSNQSYGNHHLSLSESGSSTEVSGDAGLQGYQNDGLNVPLLSWDMYQEFLNQDTIDWGI